MHKILIRILLSITILLGMVMFSPAVASAHAIDDAQKTGTKSTFTQYAVKSNGAPPIKAPCSTIVVGGEQIGRACFEAHGDEFWVNDDEKDGMHIEMRGVLNNTDHDGFTCVGSGSLSMGWQVCETFSSRIDENLHLWFAADLYDGSKRKASGPHKIIQT